MTTYYKLNDATIVEVSPEQHALFVINGKAANLRLYSVDVKPTPSPTQKVVAGPVVITATTATQTWTLVAKTAAEITAEQAIADRNTDITQIRAILTDLKNGVGLPTDRLTRLEKVVFRLAKDILQ